MYNHNNQYRCSIIRGKSQSEMDNLLPLYAKIVDNICPCDSSKFNSAFDNAIKPALKTNVTQKTLDNHRTEIAGTLFGMYYTADDGWVYPSERTMKFIEDSDTPAFFKDICYKMQFPNGQSKKDLNIHLRNNINIRQYPFVLKVMLLAKSNNIILTKKETGYYILNSLDVLQGKANPLEVYDTIISDRKNGIERDIRTLGKKSSWDWQHINEQINLLELANLVIVNSNEVALNQREMDVIQLFAEKYATNPDFDVYSYDLEKAAVRKKFYFDWECYFSKLSDVASMFDTTAEALGAPMETTPPKKTDKNDGLNTIEIGDDGERYVFEYEKKRVTDFNFRLAGKVIHLGKTRGLGYDIQSVIAKPGANAEFVKYIEVKATKRVTEPKITDSTWIDTLNITRNEWVAAQQHRGSYHIFRVYFVRDAVVMFIITDIVGKHEDGTISAVPTTYRIDFKCNAVDEVVSNGGVVVND